MATKSSMQIINQTFFNESLKNAKKHTRQGICDVVTARLENLANHVRIKNLPSAEVADLLEQEAERMQNERNEACY